MNPNIQALYEISKKESRNIIGLMSGTSLDGLDVAFCEISNSGKATKVNLKHFETISYLTDFKNDIRKVFAKETIDFQHLALLNEYIGIVHSKIILDCLKKWNIATTEVDLIASHGQTVMHAPKNKHHLEKFPNATLQIGDGDHIAVNTGIITLSDFRQKHLAAGGEGAPLAVYGDYFLFTNDKENRIMLNIGGISNFTFLPKKQDSKSVFVTDTGTGNTLIDAYTRLNFSNMSYDKDAEIAKKGNVNSALLKALKNNPFFECPFPKSTGPELFNIEYVQRAIEESNTQNLSVPDVLATLTWFSAETIAEAIIITLSKNSNKSSDCSIYVSGGGMYNPLLMAYLKQLLPSYKIKITDDLGVSGEAKEAILFALLANETVAGTNTDFSLEKGIPSVSMGKISFPT